MKNKIDIQTAIEGVKKLKKKRKDADGNMLHYYNPIEVDQYLKSLLENDVESEFVLLPKSLTAENGAKALLIGEFYEGKTPVTWVTIKDIYKKVVEHYTKSI